jgi:uncharacterized membrane protein
MSSVSINVTTGKYRIGRLLAYVTILLFGLITGFFYAYSCSVMFGLDVSDPRHAIDVMQGINREVRNIIFAPAFFGTPLVALITAMLLYERRDASASIAFLSAALVYILFAMLPTFLVNIPMNDALAAIAIPANPAEAAIIWKAYSGDWTWWNGFRTIASALGLMLACFGLTETR